MSAKKKPDNSTFRFMLVFVVLPLLLADAYVYWKLYNASGHWSVNIFENKTQRTLLNISVLIAANAACIIGFVFNKLVSR